MARAFPGGKGIGVVKRGSRTTIYHWTYNHEISKNEPRRSTFARRREPTIIGIPRTNIAV